MDSWLRNRAWTNGWKIGQRDVRHRSVRTNRNIVWPRGRAEAGWEVRGWESRRVPPSFHRSVWILFPFLSLPRSLPPSPPSLLRRSTRGGRALAALHGSSVQTNIHRRAGSNSAEITDIDIGSTVESRRRGGGVDSASAMVGDGDCHRIRDSRVGRLSHADAAPPLRLPPPGADDTAAAAAATPKTALVTERSKCSLNEPRTKRLLVREPRQCSGRWLNEILLKCLRTLRSAVKLSSGIPSNGVLRVLMSSKWRAIDYVLDALRVDPVIDLNSVMEDTVSDNDSGQLQVMH